MSQAYKKALHGFFMKVHPDFFSRNPEWQRANETSIAALNELLTWAKDFKAGGNRAPPATTIEFSFYRRPDDQALEPRIDTRFELPKGFVAGPTTVGTAERAINKFLRDLLRRADCLDDSTAELSAAQDSEQTRQETRRTMNKRRQVKKVRTLLDEAVDTAAEVAMPSGAPSIDDLISSDQVLFTRELSPQQCGIAVQTLSSALPQLMYERWYLVPLIIADHWGVEVSEVRGSITVPWSFTVPQFQSFIVKEADRIKAARQKTEEFASRVETYIADICRSLDVDDVLVTCSHRDAIPCLKLLRDHVQLLALHGVAGITIEIGDHFGYRDNGVLIFDKATDFDRLQKKLPKIAEQMPSLKRTYGRAKTMLQSIEWHLKDFVTAVKPHYVDVWTAEVPYQQRLQFIMELHRIAPRLAQYDWSDFTFALSPADLNIDWEANLMLLPPNFDGENLVRYLGDVNRDAKERDTQALAKFESSRRAKSEALRLAATPNPDASTVATAEHDPMSALDGKKLPPLPEDAWRSEYLMSSDHGDEELSVERPLAHQVNFATEAEAEDQLQWEGFNRAPYELDLLRGAERDDMSQLLLMTNRNSREEAIKRVTEELNAKYKFAREGFKLGDRLGLNDPAIKPLQYPKVHAGTYVPPKTRS